METKKNEKGFVKKLIENVAENVKEGATFVGGKVAETSAKAFVAGTDLVAETSDKIHDYTEKQALQKEERKISARQEELELNFGQLTLSHYLINDSLHKSFLTTKAVANIVEEFIANEKRSKILFKDIQKLENK